MNEQATLLAYIKAQFDRLNPCDHHYLVRLQSDAGGNTNWINIPPDQLQAFKEVLSHPDAPKWILTTAYRAQGSTYEELQQRAATPTYEELRQRLLDLADGARSKANLIASKSPTSLYTNPVEVLRALADEAERGLVKQGPVTISNYQPKVAADDLITQMMGVLNKIQEILSGQEWDSGTPCAIAQAMRGAGFDIIDLADEEADNPYETLEYSVCDDCLQFIANDEVPDDKDHAFYAGKIALELGGKEGHFSVGLADLDGEAQDEYDEFSNQECELCRSHLAGSRHGVTLFIKKEPKP